MLAGRPSASGFASSWYSNSCGRSVLAPDPVPAAAASLEVGQDQFVADIDEQVHAGQKVWAARHDRTATGQVWYRLTALVR
jgi:hypothetical protein